MATPLHPQAFSEISGISTMFYGVRPLSPYTEYEFYVVAVNNFGRGPPSEPVTCTTGETGKIKDNIVNNKSSTHKTKLNEPRILQFLSCLTNINSAIAGFR